MRRTVFASLCLLLLGTATARAEMVITIGLLSPSQSSISQGPDAPADEGVAGARLAIEDNNTTGRFLGQSFALAEQAVATGGDPAQAARQLDGKGAHLIVSLLDAAALGKAADSGLLLLNAAAPDESLRNEACRPNLLHTLPDRAMLADGLGQYLVQKRWSKWLLISGGQPGDGAFAAALRRSAKRYGARIAAEKTWSFDRDSKPELEIPAFTQGPDYDVVVVADEAGAFGDLLPYRLWLPRPVAGTAGLVPKGWDAAAEDWGAVQLQNRFRKLAKRPMTPVDYAAWLAVRAIGEAAVRARSADPAALRRAMLADDFSVAGFKGRQLSFRAWDGQMRQPIMLAAANGLIANAPLDGFMHPVTEMDSLGTDRPETHCKNGPRP